MKKYIVLLSLMFAFEGKLLAQEQSEPAVSSEEAKVLQLAADAAEDRDAAYKEIVKNPKLYLKYLRLAAKSEDPELQNHGKNLLFLGELGIKDSMNAQFIESVLKLKDVTKSEQLEMMSGLLNEYTEENRSLTEDEYMVLLDMCKVHQLSVPSRYLFGYILQQATQGFKQPKISDKDPLEYVNYLLDKSPRLYEFNKTVGCLFGIQGESSKTATSTYLVNSWRDLLLDPIAHEGRIRGRHTSSNIENTLDIALCRTDQLQRIFLERRRYIEPRRNTMLPMINLAYEWMHQSQLGLNPDRNEYLGKIMSFYFGMKNPSKDDNIVYSLVLALLGGVDDIELTKKHVRWHPSVDPNMYLDLIGYPTLETVQFYAQKSIERIKKNPKNQFSELFYLILLVSFLEGTQEFDMVHQLCVEVFPLLGVKDVTSFLRSTSLADRSRLSPTLQCELVDYSPDLADLLMNLGGGLYIDSIGDSDAQEYKDALLRLFEDFSPREQHQMFLVTQRKLTYWEEFLEKNIQALIAKLKAGTSYKIDDLCLLSDYLYRTGWEDLAFALMAETKEASSANCSIALYYTVLKWIEKGDVARAESFFNRYNPQIYSLYSSYYLAASEIAKAKKDTEQAAQCLMYAQVLHLLSSEFCYVDREEFMVNLLRGSYLVEAERVQRMSGCGLENYACMGDMYLAQRDWRKARFCFEFVRYASLLSVYVSYTTPLGPYLCKSELAQAMLYMSQGELNKAKPHIELCLKNLVRNPDMAEEIMDILCGSSAVATSEQKKQWRDQMLHSYEELQGKYPRELMTLKAIQYLQALEPKTVSTVMVKHAETDRSWIQVEPVRSWTYEGESFDGSICFRSPNSVEIRRASDGAIDTYFFNKLSEEDVAYVKAWDPDKKIKEEYAKLCAQNPEGITWLRDAVFGTQLAEAQKKMCIIVYLPSQDTAVYKHYYPMLAGKGLSDLLGQDVICILLTPRADGEWSPTNAHLLKQAAEMGKVNMDQPLIQCIQATKTSVISLPVHDCKEEGFLKLLSAELLKK